MLGPPPDLQPAQWSATLDRFAPPFAAPGSGGAGADRPFLERLVEAAYRYRTALALGLAAVTTVAVVVAWQATVGQRVQTDLAGPVATGGSGEVRNPPTTPTTAVEPSVSTSQQVGSAVSEVTVPEPEVSEPTTTPTTPSSRVPTTPSPTVTTAPTVPQGPTTAVPTTDTVVTTVPPTATTAGSPTTAASLPGATTTAATAPPPTPTVTTAAPTSASTTTASSTTTTTAPPTRVRVEAEASELLLEARIDDTFTGFSGDGYVTDLVAPGRGVKFAIDSVRGGPRLFRIRYAAGPANEAGNRYLSLTVNDVAYRVELVPTADWSTWADLVAEIALVPGRNNFSLHKGASDPGAVNLDYIELTRPPEPS